MEAASTRRVSHSLLSPLLLTSPGTGNLGTGETCSTAQDYKNWKLLQRSGKAASRAAGAVFKVTFTVEICDS